MKPVCMFCGALFENGKGFVEPHWGRCRNFAKGTSWCIEVEDDWIRPEGKEAKWAVWEEKEDKE